MAQRGINKVIIIGNLGREPEVKYMANGDPVCNLAVATSEAWKDKNTGEPKEKTEWHRVVFYKKLAEIAGQYLIKGSKVYIEGKLQTRKWQGQDGQDRYTTEIIGNEMQMLDSRTQGQQSQAVQQQSQAQPVQQQPQQNQEQRGPGAFMNQGNQQRAPSQAARNATDNFQQPPQDRSFNDDIPF